MFGRKINELTAPPVSKKSGAVEILRAWGGKDLPQQVTLNVTWKDPAAWGILLVDIARHASKAYEGSGICSEQEALLKIKELIDVEWDASTDTPVQLSD